MRRSVRAARARPRRLGARRRRRRCGSAPLEYRTVDPPELPGDGWHRVRTRLSGICGSDLSMIEGHASTYFDDVVSFPFVPGHEVVGELDDGTSVAIEPVLGHAARGFRSAVPRRRARRRRRLRPPHRRRPRAGHPDRVLLLHRRGLGARVRRPRQPAPPPRRRARRAGRADRAARRRHPRRPARRPRRVAPRRERPRRRRARRRHDGPGGDRRTRRATCPTATVVVGARYPTPAARGPPARRPRGRRRPTSWPAPCAATTAAG